MRDFGVRTANNMKKHETGRNCDNSDCNGGLYDSIINFGEKLRTEDYHKGVQHGNSSDLMLALGSSLLVSPANDMARGAIYNKGNLVICNLQKTALDKEASLVIHCKLDDLFTRLMAKLELPIPTW